MKTLTKNQEALRELWLSQPLFESEDEMDELLYKLEEEDGFTLDEIEEFICVIEREYRTGVYLYPPPLITNENQHLHMIDPPSWEEQMSFFY